MKGSGVHGGYHIYIYIHMQVYIYICLGITTYMYMHMCMCVNIVAACVGLGRRGLQMPWLSANALQVRGRKPLCCGILGYDKMAL